MSPFEARMWVALRRLRNRGYHFRRQAPFRGYYLDFVCFAHRLVVEVDGSQHSEVDQRWHDEKRDRVLAKAGFLTLRFWAHEVAGEIDDVMAAILTALGWRP